MTHSQRRCLTGRCLSPGLAEGILLLSPRAVPRSGGDNAILKKEIEGEQADLDDAVTCISEDLLLLAEKIERQVDQKLGQVFDAHRLIVNDTTLRDEMRREIAENLVNASSAVKTVLLRWEGRFRQMDSNIATSKGDDLKDISLRLRQALAGVVANPLDGIPHGSVLVTSHLLPSDTAHLADKDVAAILVHHGSSGSHAALFTREMGIPCIAGIAQDQLTQGAGLGARVLIDAVAGSVILDPDADDGTAHSAKVTERAQHLSRSCQQAQLPATTADGRSIAVMANVGSVVDTERAVGSGADGIGLYRIEHIYLGRLSPPTADELAAAMRETLAPAHDLPVYVRLLDAGADKQLPFLNFALEANPSLGQRGIRLLRAYPALLESGLRAMLLLAQDFDLHILIPMVTSVDDVEVVSDLLDQLCRETGATRPRLGAMIETPAAALSVKDFKHLIDFISFGTNDLTQYCFAADRESVLVESYSQHADPAMFRLLALTTEAAPDMPASLCGELAGETEQVAAVVASGIDTLSVAPLLIPEIKEAVRQIGLASVAVAQ